MGLSNYLSYFVLLFYCSFVFFSDHFFSLVTIIVIMIVSKIEIQRFCGLFFHSKSTIFSVSICLKRKISDSLCTLGGHKDLVNVGIFVTIATVGQLFFNELDRNGPNENAICHIGHWLRETEITK